MNYGWTNFGGQSRKYHYIPADHDRALCGKWGLSPYFAGDIREVTNFEVGMDEHSENCVTCYRKLTK